MKDWFAMYRRRFVAFYIESKWDVWDVVFLSSMPHAPIDEDQHRWDGLTTAA